MNVSTLLADPEAIQLVKIVPRPRAVTLIVKTTGRCSACPRCRQLSARIHSRYTRKVADLPWQGVAVKLELHARRFRCTNALCQQNIFCERLSAVVARYARQTARLTDALRLIGFAIGGEAGARAAVALGMSTSPDTLLRRVRQAALAERPTPRVLGVDDWAFRRRCRYGTILIDLEQHRPVDLLPDREAATLASWLKAHPGVEVISRDRAAAYAEGARAGAPDAVQVADRWHLLKNLGETVQRFLDRKHAVLRQVAKAITIATPDSTSEGDAGTAPEAPAVRLTLPEKAKLRSRERRLARYNEVVALWERGVSMRGVARELRLSRNTVKKLLRAGSFPEKAPCPPRRSIVDPYGDYLAARWAAGCHTATVLWREIQEQGFRGPYNALCRYLARWRRHNLPPRLQRRKRGQPEVTFQVPSARRTMWLLIGDAAKQQPDERRFVTQLLEDCPEVELVRSLAQQFTEIVRGRKNEPLEKWMAEAAASGLAEMRGFVAGLRRDFAAVKAALTCEWSNGQTEGQVNRLKTIKRTMYGRANFDLLRQRVLHAG